MTSPVNSQKKENTFGSFAVGVAVGIGAALLFGTDEGKKIANRLFDALPEKVKNLTEDGHSAYSQIRHSGLDPESIPGNLLQEPESTPHSYTYNEPPPPPAPHITPTPPSLRVS